MAITLDPTKLDALHDDKRAAIIANALQAEEEGTSQPVEPTEIESPAASADEPVERLPAQERSAVPEAQDQDVPVTEPPQVPAVEPPSGLTDDENEVFKTLPPTAQKAWARRERDRTLELRRGQDEIASSKKAIEQERLRLAREADTYVNLTQTIDPILAEGQKTDWDKLARENPAEWAHKRQQYESRVNVLTTAMQQRQNALSQQQNDTLQREREALVSKVPEWSDPAKHRDGVSAIYRAALDRYGFTPEALSQVQDHRAVLVLRDAMAYHALVAKQAKSTQTVQQKRVAEVPKVMRPGAQEDAGTKANERSKAIRNRAMNTRDASQKAALIAQLVED